MKRVSILASGLLLWGAACKPKPSDEEAKPAAAQPAPKQAQEPTEPVPEPVAKVAKPDESGIAWFENDYDGALKVAREQGKPIVIDMWADWCHTCLAMKKGTLRDRGLAALAGDHIWLSIDTEDPSSAGVMEKFQPKVWPTFFVVSPGDESVQASQAGSCSVSDFRDFVMRGSRAHLAALGAGGKLEPGSALAHLRAADRAWMKDDHEKAALEYAAARKAGGDDWGPAATTIKNQIAALNRLKDKTRCAELGLSEVEFMTTQHNSSGTDFMYYASDCAGALDVAGAEKLRDKTLKGMRAILKDTEAALSYDDRSDALATSRGIANKLGFQDLAATLALQQRDLLKKAVDEAATPLEEMTYVWHQVEVWEYLGKGHHILPWVEALEAKLPQEYDPPYRRGWLLHKLGKHEEAHAAVAKALPLIEGARRGRILGLDAAIYKSEGNVDKERETRAAIVAHYEGLAPGLTTVKKLAAAKEALAAMDAPPAQP